MISNKIVHFYFIFLLFFLATSCHNGLEKAFPEFNSNAWKSDKNGCKSLRISQFPILLHNSSKLIGLDESTITNFLGKFDMKHVYERRNMELSYFIDPRGICKKKSVNGNIRYLSIEIGALNLVESVSLQIQ